MAPSNPDNQHEERNSEANQQHTLIATDTLADLSEGIRQMNLNLNNRRPLHQAARQVSFIKQAGHKPHK